MRQLDQLWILMMSDFILEEEKYFIGDIISAIHRGSINAEECDSLIDEASTNQQERILSMLEN